MHFGRATPEARFGEFGCDPVLQTFQINVIAAVKVIQSLPPLCNVAKSHRFDNMYFANLQKDQNTLKKCLKY